MQSRGSEVTWPVLLLLRWLELLGLIASGKTQVVAADCRADQAKTTISRQLLGQQRKNALTGIGNDVSGHQAAETFHFGLSRLHCRANAGNVAL